MSKPSVAIMVRMPPDLLKRLDAARDKQAAKMPGVSRADLIRAALVAYLDKAGK